MSYQEKYLKYKYKYLKLKKQFGGNLVCSNNTLNMGLIVQDLADCDNPHTIGQSNLPKNYEYKSNKGYNPKFIDINCYTKQGFSDIQPIVIDFASTKPLDQSKELRVCTWNIMGIDRKPSQLWLIEKRVEIIANLILQNNIDIVCFQEVGWTIYKKLVKLLQEYNIYEKIPDEITYENRMNFYKSRYHEIECVVAIKRDLYPKKIIIDPIGGNAGYTNSLMIIEFENLHIFNCYLQAGTKLTTGLSESYIHYSRCRQQLLKYIMEKIDVSKPTIILGDFNIDLNDVTKKIFPDFQYIQKIKELGFIDVNETLNSRKKEENLTENTDTNLMRWNDKLVDKKARVDGILVSQLTPIDCKIIGNTEYILVDKAEECEFIRDFTSANNIDDSRIKKIDGLLPIFASDHYGVISILNFT